MKEAKKKVIIIAGPTAVGKTAAAIAIARHYNTEIISADSRQCYKELNIGVARPTENELAQVPHHFIATHSIEQKVTAATFEEYALAKVETLFHTKDVVVMAGGTGLYLKAFTEGMDFIPEVPQDIHDTIVAAYNANGLSWLLEEVAQHDPIFIEKGETRNPQRLMRALEVAQATGQSILAFRKGQKKVRDFSVVKIGLELPKEQLHQNINHRVHKMLEDGLLEEVKGLLPNKHLNALQTVGYKELFAFLKNEINLKEAIEAIKQNTRQYAKRQLTWFRKDKDYVWFPPEPGAIITYLMA